MGKNHQMAVNKDLSLNISLLNDSKGDKLVQYLRRAKGVHYRSDRIFNANDTSPRKSFPVEVSKSRIETQQEDEIEEVQQAQINENFLTIPQDVCDMLLPTKLENQTPNSGIQHPTVKRRRISTGLQKIIPLREHKKTLNNNAFNPLTSSTPLQRNKSLQDENFTSVSNIKESPGNSLPLPNNASSTDNANSIITISDDQPSQSKSNTLKNSTASGEPQSGPLVREKNVDCTQLSHKNVTFSDKENEKNYLIGPDKNLMTRLRRCTRNKRTSSRERSIGNTAIKKSSIRQPVIIIPITQNVTSPVKESNKDRSRVEENLKANAVNNDIQEDVKQDNTYNKNKSNKGKNIGEICAGELLLTSDEDAAIDVRKENKGAENACKVNIENVDPSNTKANDAGQVTKNANHLSLKRHRPIGHRVIKILNISPKHEQSGILDLRCRRSSKGEDVAAVDLRVEEKRRESEAKARRSRFTRLPPYLSCNPPEDDSSTSNSSESEGSESNREEIIHDNCNAVCDLPSVLQNVQTMNKVNPPIQQKIASAKKIELLKKSYLRTTKELKSSRRKSSGRRILYSGEKSLNMNESQASIEIVRSDRRLTRRTLELLRKQKNLTNSSLSHAQSVKIDSSGNKNVTIIEVNKNNEPSTAQRIKKDKKSTQEYRSVSYRSVNKESPDSGLDDNSIGENDVSVNSDEGGQISSIPELPAVNESEPVNHMEKPAQQMPSKQSPNKNSKKKSARKPYTRKPKQVPIGIEKETFSAEAPRKSTRTRFAPQQAFTAQLPNLWSQEVLERMMGQRSLKNDIGNKSKKNTKRKKVVPPECEAPLKTIKSRTNCSTIVQDQHSVDNRLGAISGKSSLNKSQLKIQKKRMPSKLKKTAEELFDKLKAMDTQIQNEKISENQSLAVENPTTHENPENEMHSSNRGTGEESHNQNQQSEIGVKGRLRSARPLKLEESKTVAVKAPQQRNKGRRGKVAKAIKLAPPTEALMKVVPIAAHSFETTTTERQADVAEKVTERQADVAEKVTNQEDGVGHSAAAKGDTVCTITSQNEKRPSNSLFDWLTTLASEDEPERLNETICKIRSLPDTITIATLRSLKFEYNDGVGYAFYGSDGDNQHFGYIRFTPNTFKKPCRAKKYDLKFICLVGSVQLESNGGVLHPINPGDLFTIQKGTFYGLKNMSQELAVLFFVRLA